MPLAINAIQMALVPQLVLTVALKPNCSANAVSNSSTMGAAVESHPDAMVAATADCSAWVNQGSDKGIRSTDIKVSILSNHQRITMFLL